MIGIVSIFVSVLTAVFTYLLKEPEFLKEIEDENKDNIPTLTSPDTLKIMTKLHLVSGVKNFYKEVSVYKTILIFLMCAIIAANGLLALVSFYQSSSVNDDTITIFSILVLLFMALAFMLSLYIYLFCLIIKKI